MARRPFCKPICAKEHAERNGPSIANQGLSTAWWGVIFWHVLMIPALFPRPTVQCDDCKKCNVSLECVELLESPTKVNWICNTLRSYFTTNKTILQVTLSVSGRTHLLAVSVLVDTRKVSGQTLLSNVRESGRNLLWHRASHMDRLILERQVCWPLATGPAHATHLSGSSPGSLISLRHSGHWK